MHAKDKVGWKSAAALVVANMIGTGVFTSLGFQLAEVRNTWTIIVLWTLGGLIALAGAFSYSELGTQLKRSGGEYHYLSELFHPVIGYLAGWVSLTVGFAAPVALAAIAMSAYLHPFLDISPKMLAVATVLIVALIHSINLKKSSLFQNVITWLKVGLILLFILIGFMCSSDQSAFTMDNTWQLELVNPAFAVALVFVTYSYTGWNAAAYIIGEIRNPNKDLPKALIRGTVLVMVLYILLQIVFLKHASFDQLTGNVEVGRIAAEQLFGPQGGYYVSLAIALFLISSISAMVWVGPRVTMIMAEDYTLWSFLRLTNKRGIPVRAIYFQTAISVALILTGTFEQVLLYCGFLLQLSSAMSVAGVVILRRNKIKEENGYRSPGYPFWQILFIGISIWILVFLIYTRPQESLWGILNLIIGLITFRISRMMKQ